MPTVGLDLTYAALSYANHFVMVFPLVPRGKTPVTGRGYLDATCHPVAVGDWWRRWPEANIGVPCEPNHLVVLDVDGPEGSASLAAHPGPVPVTWTVETGRGVHLYYRVPRGRTARRNAAGVDGWAGLDVRSNGYVVAPPSVHPSGAVYRVASHSKDVGIVPAPEWLLRPETPPETVPVLGASKVRPARVELAGAPGTRYGCAALRGLLDDVAAAQPGGRNATLFRCAARVADLVAAGHLDEHDACRRLVQAAEVAWHGENAGHEIRTTIRSAFTRVGGAS